MKVKGFSVLLSMLLASLFLLMPFFAQAAVFDVTVGDNFFSPSELTIQAGDTVRWINAAGGAPHNVVSNDNRWEPSPTASSFQFELVFNDPGEFPYNCTLHFGMDGTITVQGGASAELALQSVNAVDGSYAPGDVLTIDSTIMNSGSAGSGAFSISYFASTDNNIDPGDRLLGSANIADIAMGATLNHQAMVAIPESVPAGDYFVGAILAYADANIENNTNFDAATITFIGPFFINAGLNDAWVSADAPFQGLFFTVFPDLSLFFLSWFTFDSVVPGGPSVAVFGAVDQRWVTASGFYAGDTVTLSAELTSGGIFNGSVPSATQQPGYGTITIVFIDCNTAILTYNFPSVGLSGQTTLNRVVTDNVPLCEMLNAELQATP